MINKVVPTVTEAVADTNDRAAVMIGGFYTPTASGTDLVKGKDAAS